MTARPIEAGDLARIAVTMRIGDVRLTAHDGPGIIGRVEGPRSDEFVVTHDGSTLTVEGPRRERASHQIVLAVPAEVDLQVRLGRGSLTSDVALGEVQAHHGAGEVTLSAVQTIACSVGSGDVIVESVRGEQARITTGSGDVTLGRCEGAVQLRSGSGDVQITELRAALRTVTGSGQVSVDRLHGAADVHTGSGDIQISIAEGLAAWLDLRSGSGQVGVDLDDAAEPAPGEPYASLRARTGSGQIRVARTAA